MTCDETDAEYYRRRAALCEASAESAIGEDERNIHAELSRLYYQRAESLEPTLVG